jgi:hypothetical protein
MRTTDCSAIYEKAPLGAFFIRGVTRQAQDAGELF